MGFSSSICALILVAAFLLIILFKLPGTYNDDDDDKDGGGKGKLLLARGSLVFGVIAIGVLTFTGIEGYCFGDEEYQNDVHKCYDYNLIPNDDDMENIERETIPNWISSNPPIHPESCLWVTRKDSHISSTETRSQIFKVTEFTGTQYPPTRNKAHLGASVCGGNSTVDDFSALQSMIDLLPALSAMKGISSSEWEKDKCKAYLANTLQNALYPVCDGGCETLGVCENDCLKTLEYCGPVLDIDFAGSLLINGTYHEMVLGMLGKPEYKWCLEDILQHAIVKRCNASLIDSGKQIGRFAKPGEQCLAFDFNSGESLLNEPSDGNCALSKWDEYSTQKVIDDATNLELLTANFTWRQKKYSDTELIINDPQYKWSAIAFPLVVAIAIFVNIVSFAKMEGMSSVSVSPAKEENV